MSEFLTGPVVVAAQTLFSSVGTAAHKLGDTVFANDGRAFRYCGAGGTALVVGDLQQSQIEITGDQNLTAVAAAAGDESIVSTSTVTVTLNEYAEGWVLVTVTPGLGQQFKISGHIAYTAAAPTLNIFDSVQVALTTTSRFDLCHNPYAAVVINPTALTSAPVGVAVHAIVADEFGWLQVAGIANVLADGANAVGANVVASNGTAGSVEDAAAPGAQPLVGVCAQGIATGECGAVRLAGLL